MNTEKYRIDHLKHKVLTVNDIKVGEEAEPYWVLNYVSAKPTLMKDQLSRLTNPSYLAIGAKPINQEGLNMLAELANLRSLAQLSITTINAPDLAPLSSLKSLTHIEFEAANRVTTFEPLNMLPNLISLVMGNCKSINTLESLNCRKLEFLCLSHHDFNRSHYDSLRPLRQLKELREIMILNTGIRDKSLTPLLDLPHLEEIFTDGGVRAWKDIRGFRDNHIKLCVYHNGEDRYDYLENVLKG